jgi:hypothetical protein
MKYWHMQFDALAVTFIRCQIWGLEFEMNFADRITLIFLILFWLQILKWTLVFFRFFYFKMFQFLKNFKFDWPVFKNPMKPDATGFFENQTWVVFQSMVVCGRMRWHFMATSPFLENGAQSYAIRARLKRIRILDSRCSRLHQHRLVSPSVVGCTLPVTVEDPVLLKNYQGMGIEPGCDVCYSKVEDGGHLVLFKGRRAKAIHTHWTLNSISKIIFSIFYSFLQFYSIFFALMNL